MAHADQAHGYTGGSHSSRRSLAVAALFVGVAAFVAFLLIAAVVTHSSVDAFDFRVARWSVAHRSPTWYAIFDAISRVGGVTGMRIVGLASAVLLLLFRSRRLGIVMLGVVLAGMETFEIAKGVIRRQRPPHGYAVDPTYAFPSGHATLAAAVCGSLAYVLWREQLLPRVAAIAVGVLPPIIVGISRVYLDMHWATDVVGGWLAGLTIASVSAATYEWTLNRTADSR